MSHEPSLISSRIIPEDPEAKAAARAEKKQRLAASKQPRPLTLFQRAHYEDQLAMCRDALNIVGRGVGRRTLLADDLQSVLDPETRRLIRADNPLAATGLNEAMARITAKLQADELLAGDE